MKEQREVLIIATGGTIVSPACAGGAAPQAAASSDLLAGAEAFFAGRGFSVRTAMPFGDAGIDSSNMGPAQWLKLAGIIYEAVSEGRLCGVLITHGTDTMAYTAAWLSIFFSGLGIPVVLTGSQKTPDEIPFDGDANLLGAARIVEKGISGVYVYFNWQLFHGCSVHKSNSEEVDAFCAFEESGYPALSYEAALRGCAGTECTVSFDLPGDFFEILSNEEADDAALKVALCFALPGSTAKLSGDEKVLIIVGYGAGNMPESYHRAVIDAYPHGDKPCVLACSQAEQGRRKPGLYKNVGIGELERSCFTVFEQHMSFEFMVAAAYCSVLAPCGVKTALDIFMRRADA